MKQSVVIEGMKCEGCSNTVSKLFMAIQGVERVLVDRDTKLATVEADREIAESEYTDALAETKFTVSGTK